jgi:hypothetical protein
LSHVDGNEDALITPTWHLQCLTENKRSSTQVYSFVIPRRYVIGEVTAPHADPETGEMQPANALIYADQPLPAADVCGQQMNEHFQEFALCRPNTNDQISYTRAIQYGGDEDAIAGMIHVVYKRGWTPFYRAKLSRSEMANIHYDNLHALYDTAMEEAHVMEDVLVKTCSELHNEKRRNTIMHQDIAHFQGRTEKTFREIYAALTALDPTKCVDCPVCMCTIESPDKLYVPGCCHFVCSPCADRCNSKCPVCRAAFYKPLIDHVNEAANVVVLPQEE